MSKRFTDTEKWKRPWFRNLPAPYRELWIYILDNCDMAGFWYVDIDLASYFIGAKIEPDKAKELFKKQIMVLNEDLADPLKSEKWFIVDFAKFQYGDLTPNNNLHKAVLATLENNGYVYNAGPAKGLPRATLGAQDKVMVKVYGNGKGQEATKQPNEPQQLTDIQKVITVYKLACGFEKDDKLWDKTFFGRYTKSAKSLIEFMGNWKDAANCVQDTVEKIRAWNADATVSLDTVLNKHAAEYKKNLQEKDVDIHV